VIPESQISTAAASIISGVISIPIRSPVSLETTCLKLSQSPLNNSGTSCAGLSDLLSIITVRQSSI